MALLNTATYPTRTIQTQRMNSHAWMFTLTLATLPVLISHLVKPPEEMMIYHGISLDTALTPTGHRSWVFRVLFGEHVKMDKHKAWKSFKFWSVRGFSRDPAKVLMIPSLNPIANTV